MPVASLENNKRLVIGSSFLRNTVSLNYYSPKLQSNGFIIHDRRQG